MMDNGGVVSNQYVFGFYIDFANKEYGPFKSIEEAREFGFYVDVAGIVTVQN